MTNAEIAARLEQVADLLDFQGANPFRIRAYRNAGRAVYDLAEPVEAILNDPARELTEIQGIGKDLAQKIAELVKTGSLAILDELLEEIPESVLALLRVPGLGPKKAAALYRELGIHTLDQLRVACETGQVRALKGFAAKTEQAILDNLDIAEEADKRTYWAVADEIVQELMSHFRACASVRQIEPGGSYRRGKETVGDLDLVAVADEAESVMEHFAAFPRIAKTLLRGGTKMSVRLEVGIQVDLRVVPEESFGAALQYFTGSQAHNVILRGMAKSRGLKINEYGVFRGKQRIAGQDEAGVYATLDLPHFPPELREARLEFEWAAQGELPELIRLEDLRGDLHSHTTWSDGMNTIEEMAEAAKKMGHAYLAITDHSKRVAMAGGLDGEQLLRQWEEIDRLNETLKGIRLLKGVEVDILEGGGLDLENNVLDQADWVVASVHYGQNQSRQRITQRVLEALENPHVAAIAHPTGRLLNRRKPYEIDLEAVFAAAADHGKMLELNAHPKRLDLDDVACAQARRYGVPVVISTDAHIINGLGALRYGVLQARRGGLTKADVANTRTWPQLKKMIGKS
ncbi:MAG: DNA polymerase/3'-5' exonuclease PolX [Thermoguttaceae bacterium]